MSNVKSSIEEPIYYVKIDWHLPIPKFYTPNQKQIDIEEIPLNWHNFSNGEIEVNLNNESFKAKNKDKNINKEGKIFIFQSFLNIKEKQKESINDKIVKLNLTVNLLKRLGFKSFCYNTTYLPYSRQDKEENGKNGINIIAQTFKNVDIKEVNVIDIHSQNALKAIEGKGVINVKNHTELPNLFEKAILECLKSEKGAKKLNIIIVFPDSGAQALNKDTYKSICVKNQVNEIKFINLEKVRDSKGNIFHKNTLIQSTANLDSKKKYTAIIIDDIIDSGKTVVSSSKKIQKLTNVDKIYCCATHAIFFYNKHSIRILQNSIIEKIFLSNSLYNIHNKAKNCILYNKFYISTIQSYQKRKISN